MKCDTRTHVKHIQIQSHTDTYIHINIYMYMKMFSNFFKMFAERFAIFSMANFGTTKYFKYFMTVCCLAERILKL